MKMHHFKTGLAALAALFLAAGEARSAGFETNGIPLMGPVAGPGGAATNYSHLSPRARTNVDTYLPNGLNPQTVAVEMFRIAALSVEMTSNTATSTAGAATLNTAGGAITTEALSTAAGATYTFTLTNSLITTVPAGSPPTLMVDMYSKSNTQGGLTVTSITQSSGSAVIVFTNSGTVPFNGTFLLVFHI